MAAALTLLALGLPWVGAIAVLAAGDDRPRAQHALAAAFSLAAGAAALGLLSVASSQTVVRLDGGAIFGAFTFVPDGLGTSLAVIATVVGSLAVIFSADYMRGQAQLGRYYALVLLFIGAMAGLVLTGSLLLLFLFWELVAFCSYALISFHNDDPKAVAGGIKALIMTQVGGLGLLVGALVVSAALGTTQIGAVLARGGEIPSGTMRLLAFGFLVAASAKSAQVPFHTWLPDAMEAPTPVSALIHAATMVNAGPYLLARFAPVFAPVPGWAAAVIGTGVASALLAALMALRATDLKRLLAYSTISQLGYMFYATGIGAVFAGQFHLMSHAVYKALLFLGAGAVIHAIGTRDMRQMGGLGTRMPFVRAVFILGAASLAGIPILNGFWSKELILEAGSAHGGLPVAAIMLAVGGLTACYAVRATGLVFGGQARGRPAHDAPVAMRVALVALAAGTLTTWLLVGPLSQMMRATLPFHRLEALSVRDMTAAVAAAPQTAVALVAVALGLLAWWRRDALARVLRWPARPGWARVSVWVIERDFGFEWVNTLVVRGARGAAAAVSATQTGQLSWNLTALVAGLLALLAIVAAGAWP